MSVELSSVSHTAARASVELARTHVEKFFEQIVWQVENEVWALLGYCSWDDMRKQEYGDLGVVAHRADRPELVSRLRALGLTQQQIAATLGASIGTINSDLKFSSENEKPSLVNTRGQLRPASYASRAAVAPPAPQTWRTSPPPPARATFDCACGFSIVDDSDDVDGFREAVDDHEQWCPLNADEAPAPEPVQQPSRETDTEASARRERARLEEDERQSRLTAEGEVQRSARALDTLSGAQYPEWRARHIHHHQLYPLAVEPAAREWWEPSRIRAVAGWLNELADELEAS